MAEGVNPLSTGYDWHDDALVNDRVDRLRIVVLHVDRPFPSVIAMDF